MCKDVNSILPPLPGHGEIEFADRDDLPFFPHIGAEELQLPVDQFVVMPGALVGFRRDVDDVEQDGGPLNVAEELHAHPHPLVRPFDQPRDVGYHERFVLSVPDHAEMGDERRKRVICDLGPGGGDAGDEG